VSSPLWQITCSQLHSGWFFQLYIEKQLIREGFHFKSECSAAYEAGLATAEELKMRNYEGFPDIQVPWKP
jgi:hypothetical protein